MSNNRLQHLVVATGKLTPQRASLLCGLNSCLPAEGWSLRGQFTGPYCAAGGTLPASFAVRDLGPGESVLAQSIVLDPVCWSPEWPARYRLQIELCHHGTVVERAERMFGIRWLEARAGGFYWQSRRGMLRGFAAATNQPADPEKTAALVQAELTCLIKNPSDEVGEWASRAGIPLVAVTTSAGEQLANELQRLAQHAAVMMAVIDSRTALDRRQLPPRSALFLVADLRAENDLHALPDWADVLLVRCDQLAQVSDERPILVCRSGGSDHEPATLRAACDQLRSELAAVRQCAGYFLT